MTTQMRKYIYSIIDDDYAIEVLYYSIRKAIIENGFSLEKVTSISISDLFLKESVSININYRYANRLEAFAMLLAVRAIMIDRSLIKYCHSDSLIFEDLPTNKFEWVIYASIISELKSDEEFMDIFALLENVYFDEFIADDAKEKFIRCTKIPEYKNLYGHYKNIADKGVGVTKEVICNNAFVLNDFNEYDVQEETAYIGNTAFAYCPNLKVITFHRKDTRFGVFPIIECDKLERIIVPNGTEDYYKDALPYYKDIIFSNETYKVSLVSNEKEQKTLFTEYDELEVEHMYFDKESGQYVSESDLKNKCAQEKDEKVDIDPLKLKRVFDKKATSSLLSGENLLLAN